MAEKSPQEVIDAVVEALREDDMLPDGQPEQPPIPDPSPQQVALIVEKLRSVEENNGNVGIARTVGVHPSIVRLVAVAVDRRLAELGADELEPAEVRELSI